MSELYTFLVIMIIIGRSSAWTAVAIDNGSDGKCTDSDGNSREVGESWAYGQQCAQATCVSEGSRLFHSITGCGTVGVPSECRLVEDKDAAYPDCCPRMEC